jgi:ribosomal protein S18 acetylase RimI-like enzyme
MAGFRRTAAAVSLPQREHPPADVCASAAVTAGPGLQPGDGERVRALVAADGMFHPGEVEIAVELVREATLRGSAESGYWFLFAESDGTTLGYACYGPIAGTDGRFDLYWIVVDAQARGRGIGRALLAEAERRMAATGAKRIYVETSSTELYRATRRFYEKAGYRRAAVLPDFYRPGDGKVIYVRELPATER